jgi:chromosome segregation ATPase
LLSERAALIRSHTARTQQAISDHHQATEALKEIDAQLSEMKQRYETLQAREGQTQTDPLSLARLINEIAQAKAGRINQELSLELSLLQGIFFADQLGQLLNLNAGEPTC